jgi:hypothetical protein
MAGNPVVGKTLKLLDGADVSHHDLEFGGCSP